MPQITSKQLLLFLFLPFIFQGCTESAPPGSLSNDLQMRTDVGKDVVDSSKPQVLVYIANNPSVAEYTRVLGWLKDEPGVEYKKTADWIAKDIVKFTKVVKDETAAIESNVPDEVGVALFTNNAIRKGNFLCKSVGQKEFQTQEFESNNQDLVKSANPLTNKDCFLDVFENLARVFPPESHQYVVVTKSHGTEDFALASTMGMLLEEESREKFFDRAKGLLREKGVMFDKAGKLVRVPDADKGELAAGGTTLDPMEDTTMSPMEDTTMSPMEDTTMSPMEDTTMSPMEDTTMSPMEDTTMSPMEDTTMSPMEDTTMSPMEDSTLGGKFLLSGLKKSDYFSVLGKFADKTGTRFPVVFLESCSSELPPASVAALKDSTSPFVGALYTSDETGLRHTTINYPKMFALVGQNTPLSTALRKHLDEISRTQEHIPSKKEKEEQQKKGKGK